MLIVIQHCLFPFIDVICENQMRESMDVYLESYAVLSILKGPGKCLQQGVWILHTQMLSIL